MPFDLGELVRQAQALQGELRRKQEELARREVVGQAGAGLVTATVSGRGELLRLAIDPAVDLADRKLVEDLVVAAVNAALSRAQELQRQELSGLAGGLPLGNLFGGGS